jgi:hypothetical protein
VNLLGEHRQQHLPCAAQLAEPGEDQPDHLLNPQVGIEAEADLAMPDVADRYADAQFTAARFGAGGIEHAGPKYTELELADAALHAE